VIVDVIDENFLTCCVSSNRFNFSISTDGVGCRVQYVLTEKSLQDPIREIFREIIDEEMKTMREEKKNKNETDEEEEERLLKYKRKRMNQCCANLGTLLPPEEWSTPKATKLNEEEIDKVRGMVRSGKFRCLYVDPGETCAVSFIEDGKEGYTNIPGGIISQERSSALIQWNKGLKKNPEIGRAISSCKGGKSTNPATFHKYVRTYLGTLNDRFSLLSSTKFLNGRFHDVGVKRREDHRFAMRLLKNQKVFKGF